VAQALAWTLENWETATTRALASHQRVQERSTWQKVTEEYLALYGENSQIQLEGGHLFLLALAAFAGLAIGPIEVFKVIDLGIEIFKCLGHLNSYEPSRKLQRRPDLPQQW
jgi:hypothetical protein